MSTIDINSVAGFKAVDTNGNELGIMSLADITAAVKESIMQDAAMARSVATLSEASTRAVTDTYEDKLTEKNDLKWARALDADGNPILISKESLASVVGGLLKPLSAKLVRSVEELDSLEPSLSNPIIPFYTGFISNIAGSDSNYGWGIVGQYYGQEGRCQVVFTYGANVYIRRKKNNSSDYDIWRKIQIGG